MLGNKLHQTVFVYTEHLGEQIGTFLVLIHIQQQLLVKDIGKICRNQYFHHIGIFVVSIQHRNIEVLFMELIYQEFLQQNGFKAILLNIIGYILISKVTKKEVHRHHLRHLVIDKLYIFIIKYLIKNNLLFNI